MLRSLSIDIGFSIKSLTPGMDFARATSRSLFDDEIR
jgi:hypothetical protein